MTAAYRISDGQGGRTFRPSGDWTVLTMGGTAAALQEEVRRAGRAEQLDISALGRVDTSGAFVILRALRDAAPTVPANPDFQRLVDLVRPAVEAEDPAMTRGHPLRDPFERIGRAVVAIGGETWRTMDFTGRLVTALGRMIRHPRRLWLTPLFAIMEQAGIDAIPIVMTMTFIIGAVIALVGTNILTTLGVSVFTVELVGVAILREFGVVIAAILLAGRSASAFAAEIGSMRMNQETDAMQVMGVDQFDALVVPRTNKVITDIRIDGGTPVRVDSDATTEIQGISGIDVVQINAGTPGKPLLRAVDHGDRPIIRSTPNALSSLLQGGGQMIQNATEALGRVNRLLSDRNIANLTGAVRDIHSTASEIAVNRAMFAHAASTLVKLDAAATDIQGAAASVHQIADGDGCHAFTDIAAAAAELKLAVHDARGTIAKLDSQSVVIGSTTIPDINATMVSLRETSNALDGLIRQIREILAGY